MSQKLSLLILEDSEIDARLLVRKLEKEGGYEASFERVQSLASLKDALDRRPWDLIISDHSMPQFTALTALQEIKARRLDIPLIIVSGTIEPIEAITAMKEGASDFIMKGDLTRLLPAMERELRESRSRREKREVDKKLELEQNKFHQLTAAIEEVFFLTTTDMTTILYISPAYEKIWGRTCESLYKSPGDWAEAVHPEDRERARRTAKEAIAVGGEMEYRIHRPDGALRWIKVRLFPVRDESGKLSASAGTAVDITEEKKLQVQFQQSQKMDAIGRLAGGVAHDFNNILTAISGYSHFLLNALPSGDPMRADVEEIKKAGERAASLTRQLLAFSRQQVLTPKVLDLNALIREMEKMLQRIVGENMQIASVLAKDLGRINADPGQIEQVLLNLVVNARDAMPKGGKITIEAANVELSEDYAKTHPDARPGPHVMLAVSDTGAGMTPAVFARLFEPFFTTKEQGKGTGLGLSTVFGIIKQSGGSISVYSEPGLGSVFKIHLPRVQSELSAAQAAAHDGGNIRGSETILLAEDDDAVRKFTARLLAENGYTVLAAQNGENALEIARRHEGPIHLLLTDLVMPGMRGDDLANQLSPLRPDMKIIFTSGYTEAGVVRHELLSSDAVFIQKPVDPVILNRKLREMLDKTKSSSP